MSWKRSGGSLTVVLHDDTKFDWPLDSDDDFDKAMEEIGQLIPEVQHLTKQVIFRSEVEFHGLTLGKTKAKLKTHFEDPY